MSGGKNGSGTGSGEKSVRGSGHVRGPALGKKGLEIKPPVSQSKPQPTMGPKQQGHDTGR